MTPGWIDVSGSLAVLVDEHAEFVVAEQELSVLGTARHVEHVDGEYAELGDTAQRRFHRIVVLLREV